MRISRLRCVLLGISLLSCLSWTSLAARAQRQDPVNHAERTHTDKNRQLGLYTGDEFQTTRELQMASVGLPEGVENPSDSLPHRDGGGTQDADVGT